MDAATMDAATEAEVPDRAAADVEPVEVFDDGAITVGSGTASTTPTVRRRPARAPPQRGAYLPRKSSRGGVELSLVGGVEAVRAALDDHEPGPGDRLGAALSADLERYDLVAVAMDQPVGGTVTAATSARRSVRPNAVMQSNVPLGDAPAAMLNAYCRCGSLTRTFFPVRPVPELKKSLVKPSRAVWTSFLVMAWRTSATTQLRLDLGSLGLSNRVPTVADVDRLTPRQGVAPRRRASH
jgi:hypothetical protein